ncbi:unnamed protein product, partial [Prorocentrum cordatum]
GSKGICLCGRAAASRAEKGSGRPGAMDPVLKSQLITSVQRYFLEFLEHFELTADDRGLRAGEKYYMEQAKLMIREKKNTLYVNVAHLAEVAQ